jgi:hypothetical protein
MELVPTVRKFLTDSANQLHGAARRHYRADVCQRLNLSHCQANLQRGWNREMLRQASHELSTSITFNDISLRGRKPAEYHLPQLLDDLREQLVRKTEIG